MRKGARKKLPGRMSIAEFEALRASGALPKAGKSKYGNRKCADADGTKFDSLGELARWKDLQLLEKSGSIRALKRQVRFPIVINGALACTYIADFVYFDTFTGSEVVEDFKGVQTPYYLLKKKLMKIVLGISIYESKARTGHN